MKKVLLATSFLVAGAGFAAAEVSLAGDARMGVVYNGEDWNFSSRARVQFNLSGETDTGLSFGASFRAHEGGRAEQGSRGTVWVSGAFGKIEMGDTVGAAEAVLFDLPEIGYTDIADNDIGYLTGDRNGFGGSSDTTDGNPSLLYTYTFDAFTVAASVTDGKNANALPGFQEIDQAYALGVKYAVGNYTVGLAYEAVDAAAAATPDASAIWLGGTADFNGTVVSAVYGSFDDDFSARDDQIGLGIASSFGDVGVSAFVKRTSFTTAGVDDVTSYGLGGSYDLGGGASVVGGIGDNDLPGSDAVADLGVKFSF